MAYLGTVKLGSDLSFWVNTHTPSTGAAVDADAAPGYRVYELEADPPLLTGTMALLDDDDSVGFYSETIAVTAANGFESGKNYVIRVTGVVAGVTGVQILTFDCTTRALDDLAFPTTSGRGLDVTATGAVGVDWANVENPTTTVGLSGTTVKAVTDAVTPSAATIADAVWDEALAGHVAAGSFGAWASGLVVAIFAQAVETGVTVLNALRGFTAVLLGKSTNNGNTFRDIGDTKDVIVATVDGNKNRTEITRDLES